MAQPLFGCIRDNREDEYRSLVRDLVVRCHGNQEARGTGHQLWKVGRTGDR